MVTVSGSEDKTFIFLCCKTSPDYEQTQKPWSLFIQRHKKLLYSEVRLLRVNSHDEALISFTFKSRKQRRKENQKKTWTSQTESHNGFVKCLQGCSHSIRHDSQGFVRHVRVEKKLTIGGEDLNRKDSLSFSSCKLTQGQQQPVECGPRLSVSPIMGKKDASFLPVSDVVSQSGTDGANPVPRGQTCFPAWTRDFSLNFLSASPGWK